MIENVRESGFRKACSHPRATTTNILEIRECSRVFENVDTGFNRRDIYNRRACPSWESSSPAHSKQGGENVNTAFKKVPMAKSGGTEPRYAFSNKSPGIHSRIPGLKRCSRMFENVRESGYRVQKGPDGEVRRDERIEGDGRRCPASRTRVTSSSLLSLLVLEGP